MQPGRKKKANLLAGIAGTVIGAAIVAVLVFAVLIGAAAAIGYGIESGIQAAR